MSFSNPSQLFLTLFLLLSSCNTVMAQKIAASNDPPPDNPDFDLSTGSQNMNHVYEMDYLTDRSGQVVSQYSFIFLAHPC